MFPALGLELLVYKLLIGLGAFALGGFGSQRRASFSAKLLWVFLVFAAIVRLFYLEVDFRFVLSSLVGAFIVGGSLWFLIGNKGLENPKELQTRRITKVITAFLGIKIGEFLMLLVSNSPQFLTGNSMENFDGDQVRLMVLTMARVFIGVLVPFILYFLRFNHPNKLGVLQTARPFFMSCFVLSFIGEMMSVALYLSFDVTL